MLKYLPVTVERLKIRILRLISLVDLGTKLMPSIALKASDLSSERTRNRLQIFKKRMVWCSERCADLALGGFQCRPRSDDGRPAARRRLRVGLGRGGTPGLPLGRPRRAPGVGQGR